MSAGETLEKVRLRLLPMLAQHSDAWAQIRDELAEQGVRIVGYDERPERHLELRRQFLDEIFPVLTPLAVDPGHPFPMLRNRSLNLAVFMHREKEKVGRRETMVAVVQVPSVLPRITEVPLPAASSDGGNGAATPGTTRFAYMLLEDLITMHAGELFPGYRVLGCSAFRVTRNFDLSIDEDEADDLLKTIQKELRRRERGSAVAVPRAAVPRTAVVDQHKALPLAILERQGQPAVDLDHLAGHAARLLQAIPPEPQRLFAGDAQAGARDRVGSTPFGGGRKIEEGEVRARVGFAVGVEQMVGRDVVLIDRLLDQPHAEQAGVKGEVLARLGGNRGQVVNSRQLHARSSRVIASPLKTRRGRFGAPSR
jgi:hypothetical protein